MKTRTIQNLLSGILISAIALSCSDELEKTNVTGNSGTESVSSLVANPFQKTVGAPIDAATGQAWVANYMKANRGIPKNYYLKADLLTAILADPACNGISFYFATDPNGEALIIPIGVDQNGVLMRAKQINVDPINLDWNTANNYIKNYTGSIRAHFFGSNTFKRLLRNDCRVVKMEVALNQDNVPQLLLSDAAEENPSSKEDQSIVCPTICPKTVE